MAGPEHVAGVELDAPAATASGGHSAVFRARCSCAWEGPRRGKRGDAQIDAVEHATGHAPALKPKPVRDSSPSGY